MRFTLIETSEFAAQRARLLPDRVYRELQLRLLADPYLGAVIPGTGGIRKIRIGMRGKGTRGGGRVIYIVRLQTGRIYLLTCYAKAEREDLSPKQRHALRLLAEELG